MNCPDCGHENRPTAKFCTKCRTQLRLVCPDCGAQVEADDTFCAECGADLHADAAEATPPPPAGLEERFTALQDTLPSSVRDQIRTHEDGENRLVTALFADMSSSVETTRDLEPDKAAELVNELLKAMVEALTAYQGRVDRFLGDGVLAVFGTPHAHENDPDRAIHAALQIRDKAIELGLNVTVGINTGEVYFGHMGSDQHHELTVMGPVVNLAARLQGKAGAGEILVGEAAYRHTRRAFEFTAIALDIKGIESPVTAYRVEHPLQRPERVRGIEGLRADLIGRDEEFAKLKEALIDSLQGDGRIVTLIGEAGLGKSRLVAELQQFALTPTEDRPVPLWLEGRCLELGMAASYWPFIDIFRSHFNWRTEDDDRTRADSIIASLREMVGRGHLTEERLDDMGPVLGHLLSVQFGNDWDERLRFAGGDELRHRTFLAIRDFFVALAQQKTIVLVVDDLHWADGLSLDLISLLMEAAGPAAILLLCVYRPEREHKCSRLSTIASRKCPERYTEISLRELTPQESGRLIEALVRIENLPESVQHLILQGAHGNPFFVEEVVRSLIEAEMVYREGDTWKAREGIELVAVPESIQSVILSRVDRLQEELAWVLRSASVIGRLFRRRVLARVAERETDLERALSDLEDAQLIYQERAVPEEEYAFRHALTQEAVYQTILRRQRASFHRRVADATETLYESDLSEYVEQLAYHYERSEEDEKALEYLIKAGEKASRNYLNDEAIAYYRRALDRIAKLPGTASRQRHELDAKQGLGLIYHGVGDEEEAELCFRDAIRLCRELGCPTTGLIRLYYWLGDVLWWMNRYEDQRDLGEEGLVLVGDALGTIDEALMNQTAALGHYFCRNLERWRDLTSRTAEFVRSLPYAEELRPAYVHVWAMHHRYKNVSAQREWIEALRFTATEHHDLRALGQAHTGIGDLETFTGDLPGAATSYELALEFLTEIGDKKHGGECLTNLCDTALARGDIPTAVTCLKRAAAQSESAGSKLHRSATEMSSGTVLFCLGDLGGALRSFQRAADLYEGIGRGPAHCLNAMGRVQLARGDRGRAVDCFREAAGAMGRFQADSLAGLEEALGDEPESYRAWCAQAHDGHADVAPGRWYLEPAEPHAGHGETTRMDCCAATVPPEWRWVDPIGECRFELDDGLVLHAANGRGLRDINRSAPRLVTEIDGDFALEAVCAPASEAMPSIGGLLIWCDEKNYLRLDKGARGEHEINFSGAVGNEDMCIGRGLLCVERAFLRLERNGGHVVALCSPDGREWLTAGDVRFDIESPILVGVHAIGEIDPTVYPGAFPEGTAIRFKSFDMWGQPPAV